ncbi:hypothetical protein E0Z10_g1246 [Xylaria hypoxylon]|uniref:Uncharacterized protein n=1 Tax=Xylaria hypoxylon TaxID=37992 RepID=A0A4Z0YTT8_9PEZI|nr:hypothetical protein E0Z10_g1246 [Xylaria hypoxylon]
MKISVIRAITAVVLALYPHVAAAAAPNVTAVRLGSSCIPYPGFDGANSGPFIAVADATGRPVDGIGLNAAYFVDGSRHYGYVIAPASVPTTKITMRCFNSTLQARLNMAVGGEATWQDLVISGDPTLAGAFGFGFPEDKYQNIPVEPYWHFVDGQQVPGVFIGAKGSSTFGYVDNWSGVAGNYYLLRLLGTEGFAKWEIGKRDTVGFLKMTYDY